MDHRSTENRYVSAQLPLASILSITYKIARRSPKKNSCDGEHDCEERKNCGSCAFQKSPRCTATSKGTKRPCMAPAKFLHLALNAAGISNASCQCYPFVISPSPRQPHTLQAAFSIA
jgi:hypothetical protein